PLVDGLEREPGRDDAAAVDAVGDVHGVVLPVGADDPDHDRRPAPDAEAALGLQLPLEQQDTAHDLVVGALLLGHAVHEDLERTGHVGREPGERSAAHLVGHLHRMHPPVRKLPPVAVGMVLVLAALLVFAPSALAGNGGFAPVTPSSTNAKNITDAWWFV